MLILTQNHFLLICFLKLEFISFYLSLVATIIFSILQKIKAYRLCYFPLKDFHFHLCRKINYFQFCLFYNSGFCSFVLFTCFSIFLSGDRVLLCSSGFPGTQYIVNTGLDIMTILMPQPPESWIYSHGLQSVGIWFSYFLDYFTIIKSPGIFSICYY